MPLTRGFMGLPYTVYYRNGKMVKATTSIQTIRQSKDNPRQRVWSDQRIAMENSNHYEVMVLSGGPAGLTATILPLAGEGEDSTFSPRALRRRMTLTHEIANYPGIEKINGYVAL